MPSTTPCRSEQSSPSSSAICGIARRTIEARSSSNDRAAILYGGFPARRSPIDDGPPSAWGRGPVERIDLGRGRRLPDTLRGAVAALGNFDGLHCGHQKVIARAVEMARARGVRAVVATFDPHPVRHFKPELASFALTTFDQRRSLLHGSGIDAVVVFPFDDDLARVTPAAFVRDCLGELGGVVTGSDFAFGHRRSGCVDTLASLAREQGIASDAVGPVLSGNDRVSSTRIRAALRDGDCAEAARLLTRPFAIQGVIRSGGRKPAGEPFRACLDLGDYQRPRCGTYTVRAWLDCGGMLRGTARLKATSEADPPPLELSITGLAEFHVGRLLTVQLIARHCEAAAGDENLRLVRPRVVFRRGASSYSALTSG